MVVLQAKCPRHWIYSVLPCQFPCGNPKRLRDRRPASSFPAPSLPSLVYPSHRQGNFGLGSGHGHPPAQLGDAPTLPPQTRISHAGWPKGHPAPEVPDSVRYHNRQSRTHGQGRRPDCCVSPDADRRVYLPIHGRQGLSAIALHGVYVAKVTRDSTKNAGEGRASPFIVSFLWVGVIIPLD
jgi:hypothetical protein